MSLFFFSFLCTNISNSLDFVDQSQPTVKSKKKERKKEMWLYIKWQLHKK